MAALFPKIYDYIDANPHRDESIQLRPSESALRRAQDSETWDCFFQRPLNPSGSLSQFLRNTDPVYSAASPSVRKQIQIERSLEIQERVDKELVSRKWSRKKIHDELGAQLNSSQPGVSLLLEDVFSYLFQYQKILLNRKTKSISFVPSDLRLWRSDQPIYVGDEDGCWDYEPTKPIELLQWICEKEDSQWKVQWPTAEGKLEELKSEVLKRNLVAHTLPGSAQGTKVKKDDWARTLGRTQAIETLAKVRARIQ